MMVELEHNLCSWFFIYKTSSIFGRVWKHLIVFPFPLKDQTTTWMDGLPITQGCEAASYALVQHKLGCGGSIVPPANVKFQWIPDLYISMLRIDRDGCIVVKSLWVWPAGYMRPPRVLCKCKDVCSTSGKWLSNCTSPKVHYLHNCVARCGYAILYKYICIHYSVCGGV